MVQSFMQAMTVFTLRVIDTGYSPATSTSEAEESQEAEDAGCQMPITSNYWLYPYMIDRNNDGMAGK